MPLSPGTCLGPYQILSPLGAGGMGEVYLALDSRLDRSVALKILPADLSQDPIRRSRFEQEAKAIAALSHPHICALYDVGHQEGVAFLVMELLEGKTLAARLGSGPLDMAEVLIHAAQILDALDKAHRQGIVHRDLKPANIMLSRSGVKLLDFGLAKLRTDSPSVAEAATAPVLLSGEGQILGTVPYMAPEQLEGKPVDGRADLFAFGIIVYEMVTGRRPFEGSSPASLMGAILHTAAPPIARLTPGVPPALDRLVAVCLAKDPDARWSTARDVLLQLKGISESVQSDPADEAQPRKARERIAWAAAAVATLTAIALAVVVFAGRRSLERPVALDVLSVLPPDHTTFDYGDAPQISPDGRRVAFVTTDSSGKVGLYVRSRDALGPRLLPGTDAAAMPFWSPDSRMLGFFAHGQLKTIAISGGSPHAIASAPVPRGGAWGLDNVILFSGVPSRPPSLVPAGGGEAKPAPADGPMMGFRAFPRWLPDGRHYLFLAMDQVTHNGEAIRVASLDTTDTTELVKTAWSAVYSAGHLLFRRDGALLAQPLDIRTLKLAGSPVTVAENVGFNALTYQGLYSASDTGVLAYQGSAPGSQLVWFDRQGKRLGAAAPASDYNTVCLTSDDKQIVYDLADPASGSIDLWALDVASARPSRITFHPAVDFFPICSQASQEIIFATLREGAPNLFRQMLAAPGSEKAVVVQSLLPKLPSDWSRDGRLVVYSVLDPKTNWDVWVAPLSGGQPQKFLATPADERTARLSPDGRLMVYISNETGSFEVYVQPFPTTGAKWQVSRAGGFQPQWRHDGGELFYVTPDKKLIGVSVKTGSDFAPGETRTIMDTRIRAWDRSNSCCQYAVTRDGQRFLVNTATDETLPITLVLNWTSVPSR